MSYYDADEASERIADLERALAQAQAERDEAQANLASMGGYNAPPVTQGRSDERARLVQAIATATSEQEALALAEQVQTIDAQAAPAYQPSEQELANWVAMTDQDEFLREGRRLGRILQTDRSILR
jgi:hypothetical protein